MSVVELFFGWPDGGTWSNMIASFEWAAVVGVPAIIFRNRIGRRVSGWWRRHHDVHGHVTAEVRMLEDRVIEELHKHRHAIEKHINDRLGEGDTDGPR